MNKKELFAQKSPSPESNFYKDSERAESAAQNNYTSDLEREILQEDSEAPRTG